MSISLNYIFYTTIKQGTSTTDSDNGQHAVQTTSEHAKYEMQKKEDSTSYFKGEGKRKSIGGSNNYKAISNRAKTEKETGDDKITANKLQ